MMFFSLSFILGGHLVTGDHFDRVCADGAALPRNVPNASPAQDPEGGSAQAGQAVQMVQGLQRLRDQMSHQGPKSATEVG